MKILVAGTINLETTLRIDGFPVHYQPVRYPFFGVRSTVSGVGYNLAKALRTLGHDVRLFSIVGRDAPGEITRRALAADHLPDADVRMLLEETPQSVILYDPSGQRAIHVDLKNLQETAYPSEPFESALAWCDLAVLCNINFTRVFLQRARSMGKPVATDVHTISSLDDPYNRDYMQAADILFMSHEHLPMPPEAWAAHVMRTFGNRLIAVGLGERGALVTVNHGDGRLSQNLIPAVITRPIVNTIGAGDALFASFLHAQSRLTDPFQAMRQAVVFASWKIGVSGAADGFLTAPELDKLSASVFTQI